MGASALPQLELLDLITMEGFGFGKEYHLFHLFPPSQLFRAVCKAVSPRRAWKRQFLHRPMGFANFSPKNEAGTAPIPNSAHCQQGRGEKSAFLQHRAWVCLCVQELETKSPP